MNDEIVLKNADNLAEWRLKWMYGGGSVSWKARDLMDLRDQEQQRQWRVIVFKVRQSGKQKRRHQIVNIAAWRLRRHLNGRSKIVRAS